MDDTEFSTSESTQKGRQVSNTRRRQAFETRPPGKKDGGGAGPISKLRTKGYEPIVLPAFCMRVYSSLQKCQNNQLGYTLMESDSESALTLIAGKDVPKKSRHIERR